MARRGSSISFRLVTSFSVVLVVFTVAILVTLYQLDRVRTATQDLELSLSIRHDSVRATALAEKLLDCQSQFIYSEEIEPARSDEFTDLADQIDSLLRQLRERAGTPAERQAVDDLITAAVTLRDVFEEVWTLRWNALFDYGPEMLPEVEDELRRLHDQSRSVLMHMEYVNSQLSRSFLVRAERAVSRARSAWLTSTFISRVTLVVALVVSFLAVYFTHKSVVRPARALIDTAQSLAKGDFSARARPAGSAEFVELAHSFNRMARELAAHQAQLVETEKLAGVGRISAGVAHEINNPLTVIIGNAKILLASLPPDAPEREQLEAVAEEARLCKNIVTGLLDLSRPADATAGEDVNPDDLIAEVLSMAQALGLVEKVEVRCSVIDRELPLTISRGRLRQMVLNIVRNALEVLQDLRDGTLRIEGFVRPRAKVENDLLDGTPPGAGTFLVLVFADNGPGIPPRTLARLFEPFYTTKATGTGLGLAISYNIARAHGGFIDVQTAPAEGTTFTVGLPLSREL